MATGDRTSMLALGFGTTVAAWAAAYVGRLPAVAAPSAALGVVMLLCLFGGGVAAGRLTGRGWRGGARVGLLSAGLNILILGSLLSSAQSHRVVPSALLWLPGSLAAGAFLGALGGAVARRRAGPEPDWTAVFAAVAAAATFLLVIAGGLVTSEEAGLAVVDWPRSFGYNMFLYPLSRMTGGIYFEHAHRLFGSLVGLTTIVLALHLWRVERRRWVRRLALAAAVLVVVQGVLGGLRVTGLLTLSASAEATRPSLALAVAHGITGQLFFALMVLVAVVTSRRWKTAGVPAAPASSARRLAEALLGLVLVQLVLGALQRHLGHGIVPHVAVAIAILVLAVLLGAGIARQAGSGPVPERLGTLLVAAVAVQLVLGLGAFLATGGRAVLGNPGPAAVTLATAHQACGALVLAAAVAVTAWGRRYRPGNLPSV